MPDFFDNFDSGEHDPAVCLYCEWRCPECGRCMCDDGQAGCRPCFGCGESQCVCECNDVDLSFEEED